MAGVHAKYALEPNTAAVCCGGGGGAGIINICGIKRAE